MRSDLNGADNRLAMSITHADGRVARWGPDEPDPIDIPGDLTFSTQIPGGFKDLSCSLLRRIDIDYPDQGLFDDVRVYGPGNRTVWEGRMAQFPRSHGDGFQIVPGAVGWSANLTDDPSFQEVYVDRDLSHWGDMSLAEKVLRAGAAIDFASISWSSDGHDVVCALPNQALGAQVIAETWYRAPAGLTIAFVGYVGAETTIPAGYDTARFHFSTADDISGAAAAITLTMDGTVRLATAATPRRYVMSLVYSNGTAATPAAGASRRFSKLAAYGNHGLTLRTISGEPGGVYASDVIGDIITRAAPELLLGEIEATTFAIPHLVFADPVSGEDAVKEVNGFHGFDWGVYDGREFFFRGTDPDRLCWEARLADGARLDLEGETAEQIFNGVYVTYTDPAGQRKTVGPPGSTADATDSTLADTSTSNPVNAHGITRRWGKLDIPTTTTKAGAIQLGVIWLASHALPQRRGTLTLTGTVKHPVELDVPVWRVRAGDYIRISDHPADVPRRIIETRYTHGTSEMVLNLDNTPFNLDALIQRFGSGLVGVI